MFVFLSQCCRGYVVCNLSGPELFASDYCTFGARGRVAVPTARRISDGQLQRGSSALLPHRTAHLVNYNFPVISCHPIGQKNTRENVFPISGLRFSTYISHWFLLDSTSEDVFKKETKAWIKVFGYCAGAGHIWPTMFALCLFIFWQIFENHTVGDIEDMRMIIHVGSSQGPACISGFFVSRLFFSSLLTISCISNHDAIHQRLKD